MSSTDTTASAAAAAPAAPSFLATLEATLETDWQKVVAFLKTAELNAQAFLQDVANGVEIGIERIQAMGQYVTANLSTINATVTAVAATATAIAPNNASVAKVVSDLQTGSNDVAQLAQALQSGSSAGDAPLVTSAVNAIAAVKQLGSLASTASGMLAQLTAQSPTATQAVSAPTPNEG